MVQQQQRGLNAAFEYFSISSIERRPAARIFMVRALDWSPLWATFVNAEGQARVAVLARRSGAGSCKTQACAPMSAQATQRIFRDHSKAADGLLVSTFGRYVDALIACANAALAAAGTTPAAASDAVSPRHAVLDRFRGHQGRHRLFPLRGARHAAHRRAGFCSTPDARARRATAWPEASWEFAATIAGCASEVAAVVVVHQLRWRSYLEAKDEIFCNNSCASLKPTTRGCHWNRLWAIAQMDCCSVRKDFSSL